MKKLHEDVSVTDPNIAQQILQAQKQINDRLKRIAQLKTEMVTYQQQIAALEDQAIKAQQAQVIAREETAQDIQKSTNNLTDQLTTEKLMPTLSNFLKEDEEDRFVPYFEDPKGIVWQSGTPTHRRETKYEDRELTDKDWEKDSEMGREILELKLDYGALQSEYQNAKERYDQSQIDHEQFGTDLDFEVLDLLNAGYPDKEKIIALNKKGIDGELYVSQRNDIMRQWEESEKEMESLKKEMKELGKKLEDAQADQSISFNVASSKSKEGYRNIRTGQFESVYETSEEDLEIDDEDLGEDKAEIFFVRIPPIEDDEEEIIAKIFKVEEDSKWYVRDIEEEVDWLEDLVFGEKYDKVGIISYLADILGDVEEINREEYDENIDDKEELDDEYFPERKGMNESNVRLKLKS